MGSQSAFTTRPEVLAPSERCFIIIRVIDEKFLLRASELHYFLTLWTLSIPPFFLSYLTNFLAPFFSRKIIRVSVGQIFAFELERLVRISRNGCTLCTPRQVSNFLLKQILVFFFRSENLKKNFRSNQSNLENNLICFCNQSPFVCTRRSSNNIPFSRGVYLETSRIDWSGKIKPHRSIISRTMLLVVQDKASSFFSSSSSNLLCPFFAGILSAA